MSDHQCPAGSASQGVWLDDGGVAGARGSGPARHRLGIAAAAVACLAVLGVPAGLVLASGGRGPVAMPPAHGRHGHGPSAAAERAVVSALSATTASGSFDVTYRFDAPTAPTTTTTTAAPCTVVVLPSTGDATVPSAEPAVRPSCATSPTAGMTVSGQGTIDTDPYAMVATTDVGGLGEITVRDDGTDLWEIGGGDYGLSAGSDDDGPGAVISGFAGLVGGTFGPREGALAMMGLASPTGYLELDQDEITAADQVGSGTVDGAPVTVYQVALDPAEQADVPGTTGVEAATITAALALLQQQGYTGSTVKVSVDGSGYVRQTQSTATFSDGTTISSEATFSDFGCAGTVLMPGQQGATTPPAGCVSPDTGGAPATATTAPPASTTTTTTSATPAGD